MALAHKALSRVYQPNADAHMSGLTVLLQLLFLLIDDMGHKTGTQRGEQLRPRQRPVRREHDATAPSLRSATEGTETMRRHVVDHPIRAWTGVYTAVATLRPASASTTVNSC